MSNRHRLLAAALCCALGFVTLPLLAAPQPEAGAPQAEAARSLYWEGHDALGRSDWEGAIATFGKLERQLVAETSEPADAAIYWQAYALSQANRPREARRTVQRLREAYPDSSWIDEAGALLASAPAAAPRPAPAPTRHANGGEDADALMAIDALLVGGSQRGVPLLQGVLASQHSDKVKSRAMFVLSQLDASAADAALDTILAGNASSALKQEAIRMIAIGGRRASLDRLLALYRGGADAATREAVLDAFLIGDRGDLMQQVIETESDPSLRREAIHKLGAMGDGARLRALYASQTNREDRLQVLKAYGIAGERDALVEAARSETDPELKIAALRGIGISGGKQAGMVLVDFYRTSTDPEVRRAALDGLMIAGDSAAMLELYRQETDPALRRRLLHSITSADPDAAIELIDAALKR